MMAYLWVFLGGGLGSMCRFGIARMLPVQSDAFPWATFLANGISCVILGFLAAYMLKSPLARPAALFWMTGFCGGFSTFSTFTLETWSLLQKGLIGLAAANILVSVIICLGCMYIGWILGE